jgi:predicted TIM-barrel fold metal-dependent hydrolase
MAAESIGGAYPSGVVDVGGWVAPAMELVYEQGTPAFRGQWPKIESMLELAQLRPRQGDWPHPSLALPEDASRQHRNDAWALGSQPTSPAAVGVLHDNASARVAALDDACVALQLINPGPSIDACLRLPSNLAAGVFAAYNRYVIAYCREYPQRLGAVLQLHGSEPNWSAQELDDLGAEPSVRAATLCLPARIAPDHRHLDTLWRALVRSGLPLWHRPSMCARVWSPGRLLAYLRETGVLDRYPQLRVGFAGSTSPPWAGPAETSSNGGSRQPTALRPRVFAASSADQLESAVEGSVAPLWASDFPLRGPLWWELQRAERALGHRSREFLTAAPQRFLEAAVAERSPQKLPDIAAHGR